MKNNLSAKSYCTMQWIASNTILESNEDMILALAGQFKQLSHEPEKFR